MKSIHLLPSEWVYLYVSIFLHTEMELIHIPNSTLYRTFYLCFYPRAILYCHDAVPRRDERPVACCGSLPIEREGSQRTGTGWTLMGTRSPHHTWKGCANLICFLMLIHLASTSYWQCSGSLVWFASFSVCLSVCLNSKKQIIRRATNKKMN